MSLTDRVSRFPYQSATAVRFACLRSCAKCAARRAQTARRNVVAYGECKLQFSSVIFHQRASAAKAESELVKDGTGIVVSGRAML